MQADLRRKIRDSLDRLAEAFGRPRLHRRYPPLDELILTILSQNTSDRNRDRAYEALRRRYPTWQGVLEADRADLEETIRAGGLARTKSRVIQEALRRIKGDQGRLALDSLKAMTAREARDYLTSFKGVGEKTACCVLLFSCGHPAFPVDTHIHRVARRLGWVPAKATPAQSHAILGGLIPADQYLTAHVNLITLGRRLCRPRAPACPVCPLRRLCRYAARAGRGGPPGPSDPRRWPSRRRNPIFPRAGDSLSRRRRADVRGVQGGARARGRGGAWSGPHRSSQGS